MELEPSLKELNAPPEEYLRLERERIETTQKMRAEIRETAQPQASPHRTFGEEGDFVGEMLDQLAVAKNDLKQPDDAAEIAKLVELVTQYQDKIQTELQRQSSLLSELTKRISS